MQSFNIPSSSTPKPTLTPPPIQNENIYYQPAKYSFQSPASNSYYNVSSTPTNYYFDPNYQYQQYNSYQLDGGYNSYCQTNSPASQLIDSGYYNKTANPSYFTDSAYESPVGPITKVANKLFTIDSILNMNKNNKENILPCEAADEMVKCKKSSGRLSSKRVRTIFTQDQLDKLEVEFMKQQYMVGSERYYLANELNLNESQVKIWFQNRRIKWRKENVEQKRSGKFNNNNENSNESITNDSILHD
jgi:hypothetical protein